MCISRNNFKCITDANVDKSIFILNIISEIETVNMSSARGGSELPPTGSTSGVGRDSISRKHRRGSRESVLPTAYKVHLNSLFKEIENEFSHLYLENVRLKEQIQMLEKGNIDREKEDDTDGFDINVIKSFTKKNFPKTRHKLKAQTSKIVSSFKTSAISCSFVKEYKGHRDGIWDVCVSNMNSPLVGTASADQTAVIWGADTGKCIMRYTGHQGSVNSIKFHPVQVRRKLQYFVRNILKKFYFLGSCFNQ